MDVEQFDFITRSLNTASSRRGSLGGLLVGTLGLLSRYGSWEAEAHDALKKCKKLKGDKKKRCLKKVKKHNATHTTQTPPDRCAGGQCVDQGPRSCATNGTCAHGSSCGVDNDCQSSLCGGGVCCSGACAAANNATPTCEPGTGRCFLTCNAGWGNCDGDGSPANGCETRLNTVEHCGDCGTDCAVECESGAGICQDDTCFCF